MPAPADAPPIHVTLFHGYLLGLFPVNVLHSAVHFAIGVWASWRARHDEPEGLRPLARHLLRRASVMGGIPGFDTLFGLLPIHGHDIWLHAGTAALAAYFGWRSTASVERRAGAIPERREQALPVAPERRLRPDRRIPGSEL